MRTSLTTGRQAWALIVTPLVLAACAHATTGGATRPTPRRVESGVYRSAAEFTDARVSLAGSCEGGDHAVKIDARDDHAAFVVTHAGTRQRVRKADVFGARDCDGRDLRFIGNRGYEVIAAGPLVLYRYTWRVYGHRYWVDSTAHYFSTSLSTEPIPLTRMNLKRAFPTNHAFHDLLDLSFATDAALTTYDAFHGEFRLIRIFRLAQSAQCMERGGDREALNDSTVPSERAMIVRQDGPRAAPPANPIALVYGLCRSAGGAQ